MYCPICGKKMTELGDFPDTGTTVDILQEKCNKCKTTFNISIEEQDGHFLLESSEEE